MAIKVNAGFSVSATEPIDYRLVLTKAEMKSMNDNTMPTKYFALCKDDGMVYEYDHARTPLDPTTGKFRTVASDVAVISDDEIDEIIDEI